MTQFNKDAKINQCIMNVLAFEMSTIHAFSDNKLFYNKKEMVATLFDTVVNVHNFGSTCDEMEMQKEYLWPVYMCIVEIVDKLKDRKDADLIKKFDEFYHQVLIDNIG